MPSTCFITGALDTPSSSLPSSKVEGIKDSETLVEDERGFKGFCESASRLLSRIAGFNPRARAVH